MKYRLTSAISCILALTGCVFGEQADRTPTNIGFHPVIGNEVRSTNDETIPFPEDETFNVYASRATDGTSVITDEVIAHSTEGWLSTQYWPVTDLVVAAYSPSDLRPEYRLGKGFTIYNFYNVSAEEDILLTNETTAKYEDKETIPLHFSHILSCVNFRVTHSLASGISVRLTSIELSGFAIKGSYNLNGDGRWSVEGDDHSITIYQAEDSDGIEVTNTPAYIGREITVIPQQTYTTVKASFMIKMPGGGEWIQEIQQIRRMETEWEPGQLCTYTLNLTDQSLTYTAGITSWTSKEEK